MALFEQSLKAHVVPRKVIRVMAVKISTIPKLEGEKYFDPVILIRSSAASKTWMLGAQGKNTSRAGCACAGTVGTGKKEKERYPCGSSQDVEFDFSRAEVRLSEDFRVELHNGQPTIGDQEHKTSNCAVVFACHHTSMVSSGDELVLKSDDVDKGYAFKKHKDLLSSDFRIQIVFQTSSDVFTHKKNSRTNSKTLLSTVSSLRSPVSSFRQNHDISTRAGSPACLPGDSSPLPVDNRGGAKHLGIDDTRTGLNASPCNDSRGLDAIGTDSASKGENKAGAKLSKRIGSMFERQGLRAKEASSPQSNAGVNGENSPLQQRLQSVQDMQYLTFNVDIEAKVLGIFKSLERSHLEAGVLLSADGSLARTLYVVAAGSLRIEKATQRTVSVLESLVGVNEVVGVIPFLLRGTPSCIDVIANQDTELHSLEVSQIAAVFGMQTSVLYHYISIELSKHLIRALARMRRQTFDAYADSNLNDDEKSFSRSHVSSKEGNLSRASMSLGTQSNISLQSVSSSSFNLAVEDGGGERQSKQMPITSKFQIPVSEQVVSSCSCRVSSGSGSMRGSGKSIFNGIAEKMV
jgi:hypothetical protein